MGSLPLGCGPREASEYPFSLHYPKAATLNLYPGMWVVQLEVVREEASQAQLKAWLLMNYDSAQSLKKIKDVKIEAYHEGAVFPQAFYSLISDKATEGLPGHSQI